MDLLECDDHTGYKIFWYSLRKNPHTSADHWPKTLTYSFNINNHYRQPIKHTLPWDGGGKQQGTNVQFTQVKGTGQQRETIARTDRSTGADVTCYNFQRPGHIRLFFSNGDIIQTFQATLNHSKVLIIISLVILDSGSTVSMICYADIVDNILNENITTTIHTNCGSKDYTQTKSFHLIPIISIPHPLQIFFPFHRWRVIIKLPWTPLSNQHSTYTSMTIQLSIFWSGGLDCNILRPLSLINPRLTLTHFSPPLKKTNNILVFVKFKERIELATHKENWIAFCTRLPKYHCQQSNKQYQSFC